MPGFIYSLALAGTVTQTHAGIFDVSELAVLKRGKPTKASTTRPTKKSKTGKSTAAKVKGFRITCVDPSLKIVSRGPAFVEVKGSRTAKISPGKILML